MSQRVYKTKISDLIGKYQISTSNFYIFDNFNHYVKQAFFITFANAKTTNKNESKMLVSTIRYNI